MKYLVANTDTFWILHYLYVMAVYSAPFWQKEWHIFQRSQFIQTPIYKTEMKEAQWSVTWQVWYCSIPFHCLQLHARRETGGGGGTELNTMSIECFPPYLGYFCQMAQQLQGQGSIWYSTAGDRIKMRSMHFMYFVQRHFRSFQWRLNDQL